MVFDGKQAKTLVASLTPPLREVINDAKDWFKALRIYRDGVAHQIPIYIPRLVNRETKDRAERLNIAIRQTLSHNNKDLVHEYVHELHNLGEYGHLMTLSEGERPLMIHLQMICDFATVVFLGETLFSELTLPLK